MKNFVLKTLCFSNLIMNTGCIDMNGDDTAQRSHPQSIVMEFNSSQMVKTKTRLEHTLKKLSRSGYECSTAENRPVSIDQTNYRT